MGQMEYITPEEIAQVVVHEIRGANTGQDIISALDGSVLNPSYKAGLLRNAAMHDLAAAEADNGIPSIALGRRVLPSFQAPLRGSPHQELLFRCGPQRHARSEGHGECTGRCLGVLQSSTSAPSIGIPVLMPTARPCCAVRASTYR